jgi:2-polyprenyl-3-methyl-5-hydroxy-6-metoxy-1,4-benzoquinol methylase
MKFWSVEQLDDLMAHFDEGYAINHDTAYVRFAQNSLLPPQDLPTDPFSVDYRQAYLELYKAISSKSSYDVSNEGSAFDVEQFTLRPFPYFTKSMRLAAQHYLLIGKLLSLLADIKPNSQILECGFGWGNTTLAMAMLGHQVTGLDIEARYCELVKRRAENVKADVELINSDFLWVETADRQFDVVCFFESFHHCWDFERLLRALKKVVRPGGKIYFGAEPINNEFPVPWGVRLDGESLLVARKWGWMELGFHSDFFVELLRRTGWSAHYHEPNFWSASHREEPVVFAASDPRICTQIGQREGAFIKIASAGGYALHGPYISMVKGQYRANIAFDEIGPFEGNVIMDVCINGGTPIVSTVVHDPASCAAGLISCDFEIGEMVNHLEVRLLVPDGFTASIREVSIIALD